MHTLESPAPRCVNDGPVEAQVIRMLPRRTMWWCVLYWVWRGDAAIDFLRMPASLGWNLTTTTTTTTTEHCAQQDDFVFRIHGSKIRRLARVATPASKGVGSGACSLIVSTLYASLGIRHAQACTHARCKMSECNTSQSLRLLWIRLNAPLATNLGPIGTYRSLPSSAGR